MRDPKRIEALIDALYGAWERDPDARLGQIIGNALAGYARNNEMLGQLLYYVEDETLTQRINDLYVPLTSR